ncbi:XdhC family protein [Paraburkholderia sp. J63]|uniref:XdhC family protein n=1 Tax=Paraburkholderia sp. J63 TaxID=2805434 RepID=UPI002ABE8651|nr:XdhC family protein [Paraburkholderia sp. J63]
MSPQLVVLDDLLSWRSAGYRAALLTVCSTWPASPCERGALCAIREDGRLSGSVSGGLIEDELIDLVRSGIYWDGPVRLLCYTGGDEPEQRRLPAGAQLTVALEPAPGVAELALAAKALRARQVVMREVDLDSGAVQIEVVDAASRGAVSADGRTVRTLLRPAWRVWPLAGEAVVQAIRRVARFVHFEVVFVQFEGRAGTAGLPTLPATMQPGTISANELDALTIVLGFDVEPLPFAEALQEAIERCGSPLCVQTRRDPVHATCSPAASPGERIVSAARTPEEVAVTALAALIEMRAERLAGKSMPSRAPLIRANALVSNE